MVQVLIEYARRHKQPGNRHGGRFPAFSTVRFSFDISSAWPFVEWPRWERGRNKYKSDFAFRLYRCHPFGQNVAERRDKKRKTRESDWTPFFLSLLSLVFFFWQRFWNGSLNWERGWRSNRGHRFRGKDFSEGFCGICRSLIRRSGLLAVR